MLSRWRYTVHFCKWRKAVFHKLKYGFLGSLCNLLHHSAIRLGGCKKRVPVNALHGELVTGDEFTVAFFTFVTTSPCDDFTLWRLHCDELYDWCLLYISCRVPCSSVAVVCWWRTRTNQFWDDFFRYYFMSHFKAEMHRIRFRLGLRPIPRWEAYTSEMTHIVSSGALNSTHSLTHYTCSVPPDHLDLSGSIYF